MFFLEIGETETEKGEVRKPSMILFTATFSLKNRRMFCRCCGCWVFGCDEDDDARREWDDWDEMKRKTKKKKKREKEKTPPEDEDEEQRESNRFITGTKE